MAERGVGWLAKKDGVLEAPAPTRARCPVRPPSARYLLFTLPSLLVLKFNLEELEFQEFPDQGEG